MAVKRDRIAEQDLFVPTPLNFRGRWVNFEKKCNLCVKYILLSYNKKPEVAAQKLHWAKLAMQYYPEVYDAIKSQLDYKYGK